MSPKVQSDLRLPLHFVTFGIIKAQLYSGLRNDGVVNIIQEKTWGNSVTYGALFLVDDFSFHVRSLDAYHLCSLSVLGRNHVLDTQHRLRVPVTPITFDTIDKLERLMYTEREPVDAHAYIGNLNHPKLNRRINNTNSKRITDNILVESFLNLHRRENNE